MKIRKLFFLFCVVGVVLSAIPAEAASKPKVTITGKLGPKGDRNGECEYEGGIEYKGDNRFYLSKTVDKPTLKKGKDGVYTLTLTDEDHASIIVKASKGTAVGIHYPKEYYIEADVYDGNRIDIWVDLTEKQKQAMKDVEKTLYLQPRKVIYTDYMKDIGDFTGEKTKLKIVVRPKNTKRQILKAVKTELGIKDITKISNSDKRLIAAVWTKNTVNKPGGVVYDMDTEYIERTLADERHRTGDIGKVCATVAEALATEYEPDSWDLFKEFEGKPVYNEAYLRKLMPKASDEIIKNTIKSLAVDDEED